MSDYTSSFLNNINSRFDSTDIEDQEKHSAYLSITK